MDDDFKKVEAEPVKQFYIEDDYTIEAVVSFGSGFPDVKLKFKPINMVQSANLTDEVMRLGKLKGPVKGAMSANMEMLSKHIVEWDLVKSNGSKVDPHDPDELVKITPKLMTRISNLVRGDMSNSEQDAVEVGN